MTQAELTIREVSDICNEVLERVGNAVVGKRDELQLSLAAILAGGHVLIEDIPGIGKTLDSGTATLSAYPPRGSGGVAMTCWPACMPPPAS